MLGTVGGRPGLRRLLVSYLLAASLRCQEFRRPPRGQPITEMPVTDGGAHANVDFQAPEGGAADKPDGDENTW